MKAAPIVIALGAVALASWLRRRRRAGDAARPTARRPSRPSRPGARFGPVGGVVALVAAREIRERLRGRLFRAGTLLVLLAVGAAIVIPTLHKGAHQPQHVGVVGVLAAPVRSAVVSSARADGTTVRFVAEGGVAAARSALGTGRIDLAVVDGRALLVENAIGPNDTSQAARFVLDVANQLGVLASVDAARLSPLQTATLARARPLAIGHIHAGPHRGAEDATLLVGLVLVFVMLTQYNTWTLIGVMEEKSSRVIEVLLATVRPIQLLTGKVLGIGLLALAQATLIVVFAIGLAGAVGSSILHGTAPLAVLSTLAWLLLGYAFYSWVYAAAGSMAERQDQVQALALPLSLPILFGYISAFTAIGSGSASLLVKVLAYLPPTAPFEMPVLVGLGAVTWWEFLASALTSIAATVGTAKLAAGIYRRAILRTGGRVKVRDVLARTRS